MEHGVINNSSPEELRHFAAEVETYCNEVEASLDDLIRNHKKIGAHWTGDQYDQFSSKFAFIHKNVMQKIQELMDLKKYILKKADELEAARKISVD